MNKNKLVIALMLVLLLISLFCLYLVSIQTLNTIETTSNNNNTQKDISAQRGADISFLLIMGLAGAGTAVSKLVASKHI